MAEGDCSVLSVWIASSGPAALLHAIPADAYGDSAGLPLGVRRQPLRRSAQVRALSRPAVSHVRPAHRPHRLRRTRGTP
jgi:hypothetical protein